MLRTDPRLLCMLGRCSTDLDTAPPHTASFSSKPNPSPWEQALFRTRLPWVFVAGRVLAAGLSLWPSLVFLSRGSGLDHFTLVEHEVQAVADELDDRKEDGHRAAVEQRGEDVWRESLQREEEGKDIRVSRLLPCFQPQRTANSLLSISQARVQVLGARFQVLGAFSG